MTEKLNLDICPDCGDKTKPIPGCGWEYDKYRCGCGHETELDKSTDTDTDTDTDTRHEVKFIVQNIKLDFEI